MKSYTILILLLIGTAICQNDACNTDMINTLLVNNNPEGPKESTDEPDIPAMTALGSVQTTGFDAEGVCGKYWTAQGGTCCNQAELKARIDAMIKRAEMRAKKRKAVFANGKSEGLDKIQTLETEITERDADMKDGSKGEAATQQEIDDMKAKLQALRAKSGGDENRQKEAGEKAPDCIKKLMEIRIKTWCLACGATTTAAIDEVWDSTTKTIKVHEDTCKEVVGKCAPVIGFAKRLRQFEVLNRKVVAKVGGTQTDGADASLEPEPEAELNKDIDCGDDEEACKNDATKRKDFCQKVALNRDDEKIWGDGKLLTSKPDQLPPKSSSPPPPAPQTRILATTNSYGYPSEQTGGNGFQESSMDPGYPLKGSQFGGEEGGSFAKIVSVITILAFVTFQFY